MYMAYVADRKIQVPEGGQDLVARRRARTCIEDQRSLRTRDQVLEEVSRAD
jgi:hypothetical protein